MTDKNTLLLGKILGEIYRLQNRAGVPTEGSDVIYGLLNGFEDVIDDQLKRVGYISAEKLRAAEDVLNRIDSDAESLEAFNGFYDIEHELANVGVGRGEAMRIFTYLQANHRFTNVIKKMDSTNSPTECRTFELDEFET